MNEALKDYVDRFERLLADLADLNADIAAIASEAKKRGFEPKVIRKIAQVRIDDKKRRALENGTRTLLDYMEDIGDPLFTDDLSAAVDRLGGAITVKESGEFVEDVGEFVSEAQRKMAH